MRELGLVDTGLMAGLVVLSLVLPLIVSFAGPLSGGDRKLGMKYVWVGQGICALAGVGMLAHGALAGYAAIFGTVAYVFMAVLLYRKCANNPRVS